MIWRLFGFGDRLHYRQLDAGIDTFYVWTFIDFPSRQIVWPMITISRSGATANREDPFPWVVLRISMRIRSSWRAFSMRTRDLHVQYNLSQIRRSYQTHQPCWACSIKVCARRGRSWSVRLIGQYGAKATATSAPSVSLYWWASLKPARPVAPKI